MSQEWIQRFALRPECGLRLICFPHAGGSAAAFRPWALEMPHSIEVCAAQLPGRANRFRERPLDSISSIVDALVSALLPLMDRPYALFGHSMGAVLALEVALQLQQAGAAPANHLFLSSRRPPGTPSAVPELHRLPDQEFVAAINRHYGGIPAEILQEPDLLALLLPCLRADIAALERHRPTPAVPLEIPLTVYGGSADSSVPARQLDAWRQHTSGAFQVRLFDGGHFFLTARKAELLQDIASRLRVTSHRLAASGAQA